MFWMRMMIFLMLFFFFILLIKMISYFMMEKKDKDSPFECGVSSNLSSRVPYSIPFFLITLMFLLFDIELLIIMPFIYHYGFQIYMVIMMLILIFSLLIEFKFKSFDWA